MSLSVTIFYSVVVFVVIKLRISLIEVECFVICIDINIIEAYDIT